MAAEHVVTSPVDSPSVSGAYAEGLRAGLVGAATIAAWFFALDLIQGRPLYTPNVLGVALAVGRITERVYRMEAFFPSRTGHEGSSGRLRLAP